MDGMPGICGWITFHGLWSNALGHDSSNDIEEGIYGASVEEE
jgi:hypothetical protein